MIDLIFHLWPKFSANREGRVGITFHKNRGMTDLFAYCQFWAGRFVYTFQWGPHA